MVNMEEMDVYSYCILLRLSHVSSDYMYKKFLSNFLRFLVSMMLAPSVPQVLQTFRPNGGDKTLGSFCVTVYILGFCVGPLLFGPLSDVYGRATLLRLCITFFTILTVACAVASSLEMLITFRFLAGIFGGAPMAIGGAVVADMYPSGSRGRAMACYSVGTMLGPTLGPVLGGVIDGTLGWRWVFGFASILV
jgi:multidrug resistance protein